MGGLVKKGPAFKHKGKSKVERPQMIPQLQNCQTLKPGYRLEIPSILLPSKRTHVGDLIALLKERGLVLVSNNRYTITVMVTRVLYRRRNGGNSFEILDTGGSRIIWAQNAGDNRFTRVY